MKTRVKDSVSHIGETPEPKKGDPIQPEVNPQKPQPGKDKPEVQQPAKELPDQGRPDEINFPTPKPNIKQPKTEREKNLVNQF